MTGVTQAVFMNQRSFIVNQAPANTAAPAVTGTTTVGQTLTTTNGTWTGVPSPTFTYQWFRSPSTSISGATSSTYTLTASDSGNTIYCRVTATNVAGSASADSNTTATVNQVPANTAAPAVTGTTTVGQTLTTTNGTWTGVPSPTFTYQWFRSPSSAIGGATSSSYVLVSADAGNTIYCRVTATNAAGSASADSNTTATVNQAPVNTSAPVVTGTATFGQTLTTTNGTWSGFPSPTFTYQWFRSPSTSISGATSTTYLLTDSDVGNTIYCKVTASNALGSATANSNTTAIIAVTVPDTPTIGTATTTGTTTATVSYTAPASNGGSIITRYTAVDQNGTQRGYIPQHQSGTIGLTGLTPGTSYTFRVYATNSAGNSGLSAASNQITTQPPVPTIGESYAGGYFAGQISYNGDGVATHNLVVAPLSSGQLQTTWKTSNTISYGTFSDVDGLANSDSMNNTSHPSAYFCRGLTIGGYTDWYLPAKNELEVLYYNLKPGTLNNSTSSGNNPNAVPTHGNYSTGTPGQTSATDFRSGGTHALAQGNYWASTEATNSANAWRQGFTDGSQSGTFSKSGNNFRARAIRKEPI